jgi:G3E family GTPase
MNLQALFPTTSEASHADRLQQLMRGFLYRCHFVPGVRHTLGWRGLVDCSTQAAAWTARIEDWAGVFGLYFQSCDIRSQWRIGRFGIIYFPDPEEDLIETVSLKGFLRARQADYLPQIRAFMTHPDLIELFSCGELHLMVDAGETALVLGLESLNRQRCIACEGISLAAGNTLVSLVAPGESDQDFPAYDASFAFWQVIAASLAFNLSEAPQFLRHHRNQGSVIVFDSAGGHNQQPQEGVYRQGLYLGFGQADFGILLDNLQPAKKMQGQWRQGEPLPREFSDAIWWRAHSISGFNTLDKQSLGIDERPQLIVLTGFLGAGKTTFLQNFIEHQLQRSRFVAVIQNEIGEIGLDGKLFDDNYEVVEIDEGCVCCSLAGNLKKAVRLILKRFQPDCIIVETTGLANPFNLLDDLDELKADVRFDSVTTVIDACDALKTLQYQRIARAQIRAADIVLLNKQDLVSTEYLKMVREEVRRLNPRAPVFQTTRGDIPPALVYDVEAVGARKKTPHIPSADIFSTHSDQGLWVKTLHFEQPLVRSEFMQALTTLPASVLRAKGIVDLTDPDQTVLLHYVSGRYDLSEYDNPAVTERFVVFIGQDTEAEEAFRTLAAWLAFCGKKKLHKG